IGTHWLDGEVGHPLLRINGAPEEQLSPLRHLGHHGRVDALGRPLRRHLDDVPAGLDQVTDADPIAGIAAVEAVVRLADPLDCELELRYGPIDPTPSGGELYPVLPAAGGQTELLPLAVHALLPLVGPWVEPRQSGSQHGPERLEAAAAGPGVLLQQTFEL